MKPRIARQSHGLNLSYELPHRVHDAFIYPIPAPNGSTIIAYGHDHGIRVIWRGGRPLKRQAPQASSKAKQSANDDDAVMILSDDDEPPAQTPGKQAEFEDTETSPMDDALPIVQDVQIDLGTAALHLAGPPITSSSFMSISETVPTIFKQKVVLAIACADSAVRIVTLPLTPPSNSTKLSKSAKPFGEEIAVLNAMNGHPSVATSVALTWTNRASSEDEERAQSRGSSKGGKEWDLLVVSHSSDANGLLLLSRAPLSNGSTLQSRSIVPFQRQYLTSQATQIAFNPSTYPSNLHARLLIADAKGVLRIYDAVPTAQSRPRSPSASSSVLPRQGNGSFVATFTSTFVASPTATWKPILSAQWVSLGTAVIALLPGGQWGIWDVAGTGPTPTVRPPNATSFSLTGNLGATSTSSSSPVSQRGRSKDNQSSLAPMTPNTRNSKTARFFVGNGSGQTIRSASVGKHSAITGGVKVYRSPSSATGKHTESVLLWYGDSVSQIPDFPAFWSRAASGTVSLGRGVQQIESIDVGGEKVQGVWEVPTKGGSRDLFALGERRFVIVTKERGDRMPQNRNADAMEIEEDGERSKIDMSLLSRGELGLGGLDRMLDSLGNSGLGTSANPATKPRSPARRVGFAA